MPILGDNKMEDDKGSISAFSFMTLSNEKYWMMPPPHPDYIKEVASKQTSDTKVKKKPRPPIAVDVRFNVRSISDIDTAKSKVNVIFDSICYWTDTRLIGWDEPGLPLKLWGPHIILRNANPDLKDYHVDFELVNKKTGRLYRVRTYEGTIKNPMSLLAFPLDFDDIMVKFRTKSSWLTLDEEEKGQGLNGVPRIYNLRRITEPGEGVFLDCRFNGKVSEWKIHGFSHKLIDEKAEVMAVKIAAHVSRKTSFYVWKDLLPLWLLTALAFTTFWFEPDELGDRAGIVSTYFLAAFAMLYVVGDDLPKTDFLTKIDQIIVLTTLSLAVMGLSSVLIYSIDKYYNSRDADTVNVWLGGGLAAVNVLVNSRILIPGWCNKRKIVNMLENQKAGIVKGLPEVDDDFYYEALRDLRKSYLDRRDKSKPKVAEEIEIERVF